MTRPYRLETRWWVAALPREAYEVLVDVERYPYWWPEVRAVAKVGPDRALLACRSVLPYTMHVELAPTRRDPEAGVLEAALDGDLRGWSRFSLTGQGGGVEVRHEQEVVTTGRTLRLLGLVARRLLVTNHRRMMRSAQRGLPAALSAGRAAGTPGSSA